jgi:hypothetical protein
MLGGDHQQKIWTGVYFGNTLSIFFMILWAHGTAAGPMIDLPLRPP